MNHKYIFTCLVVLFSTVLSGQTFEEFDRIAWGNAGDGATMGVSDEGFPWDATLFTDCDGAGTWGVQGGRFVIEDTEGTCGCPCVAGEANPGCGSNDNSILIPATSVLGYCQVRVSFTVTATGGVECGSIDDQDVNDFNSTCLSTDVGPEWAGTDGMVISLSAAATGDSEVIRICGDQGVGTVVSVLDVSSFDNVVIFITAGTQQLGERYEISDIVFEGVEREVLALIPTCNTCMSGNEICENSGLPITLETVSNSGTSSFQWSGPNGFTSQDAAPMITGYTTASSGVYSVTVTEGGTCMITDDITITVLPAEDSICRPQAVFANLFASVCSNVILSSVDDNGEPGTWLPSADMSTFADSTLIFTFVPDDPSFIPTDIELEVFDENDLEEFGIDPAITPAFCNQVNTPIDFIELYNFNLDISLQINGDADLLPFINNGDFVNDFIPEFQAVSVFGLEPGVREFFIEGISICGQNNIGFKIEILGAVEPNRIDTSLCFGDTLEVEGVKLYGGIPDTILINGGACDTLLIASVALNEPGMMDPSEGFPVPPMADWPAGVELVGGRFGGTCDSVVYLYDTIIGGQRGILALGKLGEEPPLGPNFDTVFTEDVADFVIPFLPATNGCDSIVNLDLVIDVPVITMRRFPLCEGGLMVEIVDGITYNLDTETNDSLRVPDVGSCNFVDLVVDVLAIDRDTITSDITRVFTEDQDTTILGVLFNEANPSQEITIPGGSASGCDALLFVDLTFAATQRDTIDVRICPGDMLPVGDTIFTDDITDFDYTLNIAAANGGDSIVNVSVEVLRPVPQMIDTTICREANFVLFGEIFDTTRSSGVVNLRSQTLNCDSILFNVNVSFSDAVAVTLDTSFCPGGSVFYPEFGITIDESNLIAQTSDVTLEGCTRQITIVGEVLMPVQSNETAEVCRGDVFFFGADDVTQNIIDQSGNLIQFADNFPGGAANGCDSSIILDVTILDPVFNSFDTTVCAGTGFTFGNEFLTISDIYSDTLMAANGCDSIVQVDLTIAPIANLDTTLQTCAGQVVMFDGVVYSRDTVVIIPNISFEGCSEQITLTVDIQDPIINTFSEDGRCAGDASVTVGDSTYTVAGVYRDTLLSALGCDSIVIATLTVPDSIITPIDTTICGGDFFIVNGQRVENDGINDVRFFARNGCDSIVRFNVNLIAPFVDTLDMILCPGEDFRMFNDVTNNPFDSITKFETITFVSRPVDGCDTTLVINFTKVGIAQPTINRSICAGDSLVLGNTAFTESTRGVVTFQDTFGCTQTVRLDLNVFDDAPVELGLQLVCEDGGLMVGDSLYTELGDHTAFIPYQQEFVSLECDSVINFTIAYHQPIFGDIFDESICRGDAFPFGGAMLTEPNTYFDTLVASSTGCDSIVQLNLEVIEPVTLTDPDVVLCPGESYTAFNGDVITNNGNLTMTTSVIETFSSNVGCDTTVNVLITTLRGTNTINDLTICEGSSHTVGDSTFTSPGNYLIPLAHPSFACDSVVELNLSVISDLTNDLGVINLCEGDEFIIGDTTVTTSGSYSVIVAANRIATDGTSCDSTIIAEVNFQSQVIGPMQNETICEGESFSFGGEILTIADTYFDTLVAASTGCDSIVQLNLTVVQPVTLTEPDVVLCPGESYTAFNGDVITNNGNLTMTTSVLETFSSNVGCDTTVNVLITTLRGTNTINDITICEGSSHTIGDSTFTSPGNYLIPLAHPSFACDSIVELNLSVISDLTNDLGVINLCEGDEFIIGDTTVTTTGSYSISVASNRIATDGTSCDSLIIAVVNFQSQVTGPTQNETICEGESFSFGGEILTIADTYFDTLVAASTGCDSIVQLNLTVVQPVTLTEPDVVLCPGEDYVAFNGERIFNDGTLDATTSVMQTFTSNAGCDTTVNVIITTVRGTNTINDIAICDGDSHVIGDSTFTESGTYLIPLERPGFLCDSVVELNLTVIDDLSTELGNVTICEGESFTVGNMLLTTSGSFSISIPSDRAIAQGLSCDSIVTVNLIVEPIRTTTLSQTICDGETFEVGLSTYMGTGTFSDTLSTAAGCDSIVNLDLRVIVPALISIDTAICFGEVLPVGGQILDRSITTDVIVPSSEGCDSIVFTVDLEVISQINTVNNASICRGETVTVGSSTYDQEGTFEDVLTAASGCDSTVRTIIVFREIAETPLSMSICTGDIFDFGGEERTESGEYRDTIVTAAGCDSILVLTLEVVDQIETNLEAITICDGETIPFGGRILTTSDMYSDTLVSQAGCDSIVFLELTVTPPLSVDTESIVGACDGVSNGSFVISDIPGSTGPYTISGIPGVNSTATLPLTVTGITAQTYNYTVTDSNGCAASGTAVITEDRSNALDIVSVEIDPTGVFDLFLDFEGTAVSVTWDNIPGLSCYDCPNPQAMIEEMTTYTVTVVDVDGCISVASITLEIDEIGNVYVPTIFNPNSQGGNDRFFIQGEDPDAFYDLWIYDRWGNLVYSVLGAPINDREFGWDGRFGSKEMNPGVFVFTSRIFKANGVQTTTKGDITLIH